MIDALNLGFFSRSRIKLMRQTEIAECGLASIAMVADFHGLKVDLGSMRRRFVPSQRGAPLKALMAVADRIGLAPRAVKLPLEELRNLHAPAVLHWDLNHYVVLEKIWKGRALIHNPASGSKWYSIDELSNRFTGVALELRPTDNFVKRDERERLKLSQLWHSMTGLKRSIFQTLLLSAVLQAFVLASPYYMQLAIDRVLPARDGDLLFVLALGFGLFMLINVAATFLRSFVLLWAGTSLGYGLATSIARRLFRLPIEWFEKRNVGDILSRFQSITPIQDFLLTGAVATLLDGAMAILTLTVMFFYSPTLALIALVAFALYLIVRTVSFAFERDAIEETITTGASEQSTLIETLRGMTTLRLFNREMTRHALWQSKLTDNLNADVRRARIGIWQQMANGLLFGTENIFTVYLAIGFVIEGGFSVGMVFAFMAYKTQFSDKATSLVDQFIKFRLIGLHLDRLSDIALSNEDVSFGRSAEVQSQLKGKIELKDLQFRYSASDPMVLDGLNLVIEPGEHIAITGPSGGGKSTLVKILLGLVEPNSGTMHVDGMPLEQFGYKSYHDQVSAVLQDDMLFAGTIGDNIALFDDNPDIKKIVSASEAAAIDQDIQRMPMQLDTLAGDMGSTLSGGQKQRILLARAIYRAPKVLIMDEATAHLDGAAEARVNDAIRKLGISRIVIAHRQETVAAADKAYVLDHGVLREQ